MNEGKNKNKLTLTKFTEIVTVGYLLCFFIVAPVLLLIKHRHAFPAIIIGTLIALVFIILDRVVRKFDDLEQKLKTNNNEDKSKTTSEDIFNDDGEESNGTKENW